MVGTKTTERPGTRAVARHIRVSASKAREVLDLIRGKSYGSAAEILEFSERAVSTVVAKCLDSAVANAEHNDGIAAEELYVTACYADVGPTLKRWRPRARGRATRILKRTCHITIIVDRYTDSELDAIRERAAARGRAGSSVQAAEARRRRVERSRVAEEAAEAAEAVETPDGDTPEAVDGSVEPDPTDVETVDVDATPDDVDVDADTATDHVDADVDESTETPEENA
jgi:large subunit ribosomal protein L22